MTRSPVTFWTLVLRNARSDVTAAMRGVGDAQAELAAAQAERVALEAQFDAARAAAPACALLVDQGAWVVKLGADLRGKQMEIVACLGAVDTARQALAEAKGMETVAERRLVEAKRAARKAAEARELTRILDLAMLRGQSAATAHSGPTPPG
jgi:hypothetical protein